jgi:hypothetical protein
MLTAEWFDQFVQVADTETALLRQNGANCQADARLRLVEQLKEALLAAGDETVSVEEASAMTGVNPETVRRAVRRGDLPDGRSSKHQNIRIRKNDLPKLAARKRAARKPTSKSNAVEKFL